MAGPDGQARAPGSAETEASLLARARAGDVAAFERLSGAYADRLFMLLVRLLGDRAEAEDVAQEVMLRAWRGIARFRGQSSYFTWLYRIAVNEANRALEKRGRLRPGSRSARGNWNCPPPRKRSPPGKPRTANCAGPWVRPWPACRPRCAPPSCSATSRGSPRSRPRRSPVSARPPSRAGCTRQGCRSARPSATRPWPAPADEPPPAAPTGSPCPARRAIPRRCGEPLHRHARDP